MFDFIKEIFGKNINLYFLLTLLISWIFISKIEINSNNLKVKISMIYILFYMVIFYHKIPIIQGMIYLLIMAFIFLEFILIDKFTKKIMKNIFLYFLDFFYKIVFEYKILYFAFSLFFLSNCFRKLSIKAYAFFNIDYFFKNDLSTAVEYFNIGVITVSLILLGMGIVSMSKEKFAALSFEEISKKIDSIMPFWRFSSNAKLKDFSKILTYKEDKSYFYRKNTYNWISIEFILYKLKRMFSYCSRFKITKNKYIRKISHYVIYVFYVIYKVTYFALKSFIRTLKIIRRAWKQKKPIKKYIRGYSTIEMQLIRTLSIQHGYTSKVIQRKFYEFIYSVVFFDSFKNNYQYFHYSNIDEYKLYLIYIYIRVAPVRINDIAYSSILKMYNKGKINDISNEEFYIWTLGLSHKKIDFDILERPEIEVFKMDKGEIKQLLKRFGKQIK